MEQDTDNRQYVDLVEDEDGDMKFHEDLQRAIELSLQQNAGYHSPQAGVAPPASPQDIEDPAFLSQLQQALEASMETAVQESHHRQSGHKLSSQVPDEFVGSIEPVGGAIGYKSQTNSNMGSGRVASCDPHRRGAWGTPLPPPSSTSQAQVNSISRTAVPLEALQPVPRREKSLVETDETDGMKSLPKHRHSHTHTRHSLRDHAHHGHHRKSQHRYDHATQFYIQDVLGGSQRLAEIEEDEEAGAMGQNDDVDLNTLVEGHNSSGAAPQHHHSKHRRVEEEGMGEAWTSSWKACSSPPSKKCKSSSSSLEQQAACSPADELHSATSTATCEADFGTPEEAAHNIAEEPIPGLNEDGYYVFPNRKFYLHQRVLWREQLEHNEMHEGRVFAIDYNSGYPVYTVELVNHELKYVETTGAGMLMSFNSREHVWYKSDDGIWRRGIFQAAIACEAYVYSSEEGRVLTVPLWQLEPVWDLGECSRAGEPLVSGSPCTTLTLYNPTQATTGVALQPGGNLAEDVHTYRDAIRGKAPMLSLNCMAVNSSSGSQLKYSTGECSSGWLQGMDGPMDGVEGNDIDPYTQAAVKQSEWKEPVPITPTDRHTVKLMSHLGIEAA